MAWYRKDVYRTISNGNVLRCDDCGQFCSGKGDGSYIRDIDEHSDKIFLFITTTEPKCIAVARRDQVNIMIYRCKKCLDKKGCLLNEIGEITISFAQFD